MRRLLVATAIALLAAPSIAGAAARTRLERQAFEQASGVALTLAFAIPIEIPDADVGLARRRDCSWRRRRHELRCWARLVLRNPPAVPVRCRVFVRATPREAAIGRTTCPFELALDP